MSMRRLVTIELVLLGVVACGAEKADDRRPEACHAERVTECPEPAPVFADVAPIFQEVCSTCHSEPGGPWPLDDYQHIADWQDVIRDDLLTCAMPPPNQGVTLSDSDRQLILTWIRCGYRE